MYNTLKEAIKVLIISLVICFTVPTTSAYASIIKNVSENGIMTYYVSTKDENALVFNLTNNRMEKQVKVIYTNEMIPSSKENLRYYYSTEGFKCNYLYQDNIIPYLNEVYVSMGFGIISAKYNKKNNTVTVIYNFYYYDTKDQSKSTNDKINKAIKNNISNLQTDYQKAQWAYQWVLENIHYDDTQSNFSAYGGLADSGTVCGGYATYYCAIVNRLGLNCRFVEGFVRDNKSESHAWNIIKLDSQWYCVDTTWGDNACVDKYFLKSKDTFLSSECGIHDTSVYNNYINTGQIFSDTDYIDNGISESHGVLPSVYNIKMDILKVNTLEINETYNFMISNQDNILISFKSEDTNIASVNEDGVIVGMKDGTTIITAYNTDLNIEQSCEITVISSKNIPTIADNKVNLNVEKYNCY